MKISYSKNRVKQPYIDGKNKRISLKHLKSGSRSMGNLLIAEFPGVR